MDRSVMVNMSNFTTGDARSCRDGGVGVLEEIGMNEYGVVVFLVERSFLLQKGGMLLHHLVE